MAARRKKSDRPDDGAPAPPPEVVEAEVVEDPARPQRARRPRSTEVVVDARPVARAHASGAAAEAEDLDEQAEAAEPEVGEPEPAELEAEPVDETALVPTVSRTRLAKGDPLAAYMAEVTRHPLLTREQEVELSRRYRDTGDVRAAYTLVASNLRLVVKLAHEYHRNPLSLLDLVQEGNIGLMQAVKKFDPERGVKLSSYAAWWIRAYILRYIMDNWKMVKLGTTEAQRKLFFKLRQEQERLSKQGIEVTPRLLAERLNVTEQDVVEMDQRLGNDEVSIDAPLNADDDRESRADRLLPASGPAADDTLANAELRGLFRDKLQDFAKHLNEKERFIFEKRLVADEPMTLQDIGAQYGVSRERARQIEAALIGRMRKYMQEHIPDFHLLEGEGD
ncbi:MAG: RNA polymerase factor sigma-32 [Myxococcaceae bacterium]|jgi:RNA polymerase sigma-32 factor|nr:RNA polymerase factor sigma-32 [Myxococcaceae bacterium]MCA3010904.1 RNA polymerase factor sigma-32 [Myxococcaceae bacterium]